MNQPIRTTTPTGEPIVILPAAEYERLVTAAADVRDGALADRALADYRAGRSAALDSDEMKALLAAATPLAFWRRKRDLTQAALAEAVGSSQAYLAQVEAGRRTGTVALYAKLAKALGVAMEDLCANEDEA